jgi:hypothetical protein
MMEIQLTRDYNNQLEASIQASTQLRLKDSIASYQSPLLLPPLLLPIHSVLIDNYSPSTSNHVPLLNAPCLQIYLPHHTYLTLSARQNCLRRSNSASHSTTRETCACRRSRYWCSGRICLVHHPTRHTLGYHCWTYPGIDES